MGKFQTSPYLVDECNWLQFSVWLGEQQPGSNYNVRFKYVFVRKGPNMQPLGTGMDHSLHPRRYDARTDRILYNRWYRYNWDKYCIPGVVVNPDLAIVMGTVPTLYGKVESSHSSDDTSFEWLDQCSVRILSYTNKCFSVYAKSDIIHIKFYQ